MNESIHFLSKYKGSVLGILWSVLKPLLTMIVLTIIFSTIFHGAIENYPVYLLSGRCVFDYFTSANSLSMMAIRGNANILKRTAAPKYIFVLGGIASEFINFCITFILLIGVMIVTHAPFHFETMFLSVIPIISLIIMITGMGLIFSILCSYYSDIQYIWGVISMIIMYASAIFYPIDIIPEVFRQYIILNPVFWIIDQFRDFMVYGTMHDPLNVINSLLLSCIIFVFGIIVFKKYEQRTLLSV